MSGYIEMVFVDEAANAFIPLGGAGFRTKAVALREFQALPRASGFTSFLADLLGHDGFTIIDTAEVDASIVEVKLGEPIAVLMERGRSRLLAGAQP